MYLFKQWFLLPTNLNVHPPQNLRDININDMGFKHTLPITNITQIIANTKTMTSLKSCPFTPNNVTTPNESLLKIYFNIFLLWKTSKHETTLLIPCWVWQLEFTYICVYLCFQWRENSFLGSSKEKGLSIRQNINYMHLSIKCRQLYLLFLARFQ